MKPFWTGVSLRLKRGRGGRVKPSAARARSGMVLGDGQGIPLGVRLESASPGEVTLADATLAQVRVPRAKGRPRQKPKRVIAAPDEAPKGRLAFESKSTETKFFLLSALASWLLQRVEAGRFSQGRQRRRAAVKAERRAFTGSSHLCHARCLKRGHLTKEEIGRRSFLFLCVCTFRERPWEGRTGIFNQSSYDSQNERITRHDRAVQIV